MWPLLQIGSRYLSEEVNTTSRVNLARLSCPWLLWRRNVFLLMKKLFERTTSVQRIKDILSHNLQWAHSILQWQSLVCCLDILRLLHEHSRHQVPLGKAWKIVEVGWHLVDWVLPKHHSLGGGIYAYFGESVIS